MNYDPQPTALPANLVIHDSDIQIGETDRALQFIRIVRGLRGLKSVNALSGIQTVIQTIIRSVPDMTNIVLLLLILMLIFAVIGVSLFGEVYPERFGDLGTTYFTLFIVITQDGWVRLFDVLEERGEFVTASLFFGTFIVVGPFVFVNLIVGAVVTNLELAFELAKHVKKEQNRRLMTSTETAGGEGKRQVLPMNISRASEVYQNQIPLMVPDFEQLSPKVLEDYFLILTLVEENLAEYVRLKSALSEMLVELKVLNRHAQTQIETADDAEDKDEEVEDLPQGDVLSSLITQNR